MRRATWGAAMLAGVLLALFASASSSGARGGQATHASVSAVGKHGYVARSRTGRVAAGKTRVLVVRCHRRERATGGGGQNFGGALRLTTNHVHRSRRGRADGWVTGYTARSRGGKFRAYVMCER
jgi:hypothetical protein